MEIVGAISFAEIYSKSKLFGSNVFNLNLLLLIAAPIIAALLNFGCELISASYGVIYLADNFFD